MNEFDKDPLVAYRISEEDRKRHEKKFHRLIGVHQKEKVLVTWWCVNAYMRDKAVIRGRK